MEKYGMCIGKFYPLHKGHINMIQKASSLVDHLFVIVSHSDIQSEKLFEQSNLKRPLTARDKLRIVQKTFQMQPMIQPILIDETNVPSYPNGWEQWAELVKNSVLTSRRTPKDFTNFSELSIFINEPSDVDGYQKYFGCEVLVLDQYRTDMNISATEIRKDPAKYWEFLPRASREAIAPTIEIAGGESSGKTIIVDKLGNFFGTTTVWEYGRTYCEAELGGDEAALQYDDYAIIANQHYQDIRFARRNANKFVISDTGYVATQAFCLVYEGRKHPSVQEKIDNDRFDLTILLDNSTKWVDDGQRLIGNDEGRIAFQNTLKQIYQSNNISYVEIKTSSYLHRYEICKAVISAYINEKYSIGQLQHLVDMMEHRFSMEPKTDSSYDYSLSERQFNVIINRETSNESSSLIVLKKMIGGRFDIVQVDKKAFLSSSNEFVFTESEIKKHNENLLPFAVDIKKAGD
ncbi:multifunctional transcriptional regulator/nicotinamide-nucleotide adenylyltransferase/ribosylnicotinamide kinase NadR [Enterococcus sp. DIV1059_2]|uniref:multifunctional transcriptional regulator/nicotinamide-nucleotide adenylyltransferase/ribosylnicotinamide kinase NadR n=1 Tax=Enterococcus sp. DIV1059_2 TaxID=2774664 RepID=UPI003F276143